MQRLEKMQRDYERAMVCSAPSPPFPRVSLSLALIVLGARVYVHAARPWQLYVPLCTLLTLLLSRFPSLSLVYLSVRLSVSLSGLCYILLVFCAEPGLSYTGRNQRLEIANAAARLRTFGGL